MKKARFWAFFMTALLSFSTFMTDYSVAFAEELGESADFEVSEPVQLGADQGLMLSVIDDEYGPNVEAGVPEEPVYEEPVYEEPVYEEPAAEGAGEGEPGEEPAADGAGEGEPAAGGTGEEEPVGDPAPVIVDDLEEEDPEADAAPYDSGKHVNLTVDEPFEYDFDGDTALISINSYSVDKDGYVEVKIADDKKSVTITGTQEYDKQIKVSLNVTYQQNANKEKTAECKIHIDSIKAAAEEPGDVEDPQTPQEPEEPEFATGKIKFSVEWSTISAIGGKVLKLNSTNQHNDLSMSYVKEIPASIETTRASKYPSYRIEWYDYEICEPGNANSEIHINGKLIGPYTVQQINAKTGETINTFPREGRFYKSVSDHPEFNREIQYATEADKTIAGFTYVPEMSTDSLKMGADQSKNVIKLYFVPEGETVDQDSIFNGELTWSIEWGIDGLRTTSEGKVLKRDSANRYEGVAAVAQYLVERPSSLEATCATLYPGFRLEWWDYERQSDTKVHINGRLMGNYTVEWIDKATGDPIQDPAVREGRLYNESDKDASYNREIQSATDADKNLEGWTYLPDESTDTLKIGKNASENVIKLYFEKSGETTYSVKYYYQDFEGGYTPDESRTVTGETVYVGDEVSIDAPDATSEFNGIPYKLNTSKTKTSITVSENADENEIGVYYDLLDAKYKVNVFRQGQDRKYPDKPSDTPKTFNCKVGERLEYEVDASLLEKEKSGYGTISYEVDTELSNLVIDSAAADTDGSINVINVYLKRTVNDVYYSILYPGEVMPSDGLPQDEKRFFPSRYARFTWKGTAKAMPEGQWYDYDASGVKIENEYMLDVPWDQIRAGLERHFGDPNLQVIWYAYKIEPYSYVGSHAMINGYVASAVNMKYDQNRPDGKTSKEYTDTNTLNIGKNYKILGSEGDAAYELTQGVPGYAFRGWALAADATEPKFDAGDTIELENPLTFYGVWDRVVPDVLTVKAANGEWDYDGEAHTKSEVGSVVCGVAEDGSSSTSGNLPEGWTVEVTMTEDSTITDVGEVANKIATVTVKNASGEDVTDLFTTINKENGTLTVKPITLTITTGSDSKVYDGEPLTCDTITVDGLISADASKVTYKTTGSVTDVTTGDGVDNTYEIDWGGVNKDNYDITENLGKLSVTEYTGTITVSVKGGTYVYDGEEHSATVAISAIQGTPGDADAEHKRTGVDAQITSQELPEGYKVSEVKTVSLIDKEALTGEEVLADTTVKIVNKSGKDVTDKLNISKVDDSAALEIVPTDLYVTTYSNSGVYNGRPVTAGGKMDGVVPRDADQVKLVVTGRQIEVGQSRNTYRIDWGNAKSMNYEVEASRGWLTVYDSFIPDNPTPDNPTPDNPTPDNPTPDNPTPDNPTPDNPTPDEPTLIPTPPTTTIPDEDVPLAGVLGAARGIEADYSSVLGQRRAAAESGVLGARRDAATQDANHMAMYLMLMGVATGVGGAYAIGRRKKHED